MSQVRVAILGCGAIATKWHLPTALADPDIRVAALVDAVPEQAGRLRDAHRLDCAVFPAAEEAFPEVDAVINTLPNHLHAPVNMQALRSGVHVYCEKPWAIDAAQMRECRDLAVETGLAFAAAAPWRWVEGRDLLETALGSGLLGDIECYDWQNGAAFDWPSASNFYFSKERAGGGVLIDEGVHFVDFLLDLLGPATVVGYRDDDWGSGIEANSSLVMQHEGAHGPVRGELRLSRTYVLENRLQFRGSEATLELDRRDPSVVSLRRTLGGRALEETLHLPETRRHGRRNPFRLQLADFVASIREGRAPAVDGDEALKTMEIVDRCYGHAERIAEPWATIGGATAEAPA